MEAKPRVHVVDDEAEVREALAVTIRMMDLEVSQYSSGPEFLDRYEPSPVECMIVDLRMPDMSGLELMDILCERRIRLPAIMISGHGDIEAAVHAMRAGAIDFLEKPYSMAALRETIEQAIRVDSALHKKTAWHDAVQSRHDRLSEEEKDVLRLTVAGDSDKAIATKMHLSIRTIQLRRASLMKKMQARSRSELIQMAQALANG